MVGMRIAPKEWPRRFYGVLPETGLARHGISRGTKKNSPQRHKGHKESQARLLCALCAFVVSPFDLPAYECPGPSRTALRNSRCASGHMARKLGSSAKPM